jgi:hypothetical protein
MAVPAIDPEPHFPTIRSRGEHGRPEADRFVESRAQSD